MNLFIIIILVCEDAMCACVRACVRACVCVCVCVYICVVELHLIAATATTIVGSKHIKGSEERYLLGQNTYEFSG